MHNKNEKSPNFNVSPEEWLVGIWWSTTFFGLGGDCGSKQEQCIGQVVRIGNCTVPWTFTTCRRRFRVCLEKVGAKRAKKNEKRDLSGRKTNKWVQSRNSENAGNSEWRTEWDVFQVPSWVDSLFAFRLHLLLVSITCRNVIYTVVTSLMLSYRPQYVLNMVSPFDTCYKEETCSKYVRRRCPVRQTDDLWYLDRQTNHQLKSRIRFVEFEEKWIKEESGRWQKEAKWLRGGGKHERRLSRRFTASQHSVPLLVPFAGKTAPAPVLVYQASLKNI